MAGRFWFAPRLIYCITMQPVWGRGGCACHCIYLHILHSLACRFTGLMVPFQLVKDSGWFALFYIVPPPRPWSKTSGVLFIPLLSLITRYRRLFANAIIPWGTGFGFCQ